ncbi:MAG: hypothetical protein J6W82_04680, partial [Bacteroidales bacterium]|nr:hypothetical protein [Bacteroidales bacterium]
PKRLDGQHDPAVWFDVSAWHGADSLRAEPFWTMSRVAAPAGQSALAPVLKLCEVWAAEAPKNGLDIVWGPFRGGWFVALCKKTRSDLGWKSISFVIPPEGLPAGSNIWNHSHSVNWLEHNIGYNLFPNLPPHIQDIIEEITAAELICPFQEFDPGLADTPDQEIDYDWEFDYRDI